MDIIVTSLIVSLAINFTMFLVAYRLQSDKLTDISYAATFLTLAVFGFMRSDASLYHLVLAGMVGVWAFRLGGFLLYRVMKTGRDRRFDEMRGNFVKFGGFWLIQAVSVWVLMIASMLAFESRAELTPLALVGMLVWLIGLGIEATADIQKFRFSSNKVNKDKWIAEGIWKYSRHPNYFGEILVWAGVYMYVATSLATTQALVALVSPLFIITLLLFVSGIPILEKYADKKWGKDKVYQDYKKRTSILVPFPPKADRRPENKNYEEK